MGFVSKSVFFYRVMRKLEQVNLVGLDMENKTIGGIGPRWDEYSQQIVLVFVGYKTCHHGIAVEHIDHTVTLC